MKVQLDETALRALIALGICAVVWIADWLRRYARKREQLAEKRRREDEEWLSREPEEVSARRCVEYQGGGGCGSVNVILAPGTVFDLPENACKCERCGARTRTPVESVAVEWHAACRENRLEARLCTKCAAEVRNTMLEAWGRIMNDKRSDEE